LERFIGGGKRLEVPPTVLPEAKELITKCWDQSPKKRPDFPYIVQKLTELIETLPASEPAPVTHSPISSSSSSRMNIAKGVGGSGGEGRVPVKYIPQGNLNLIGWCGDINRDEAKSKLIGCPVGTFLLRWSYNRDSYVLSYSTGSDVQHIASIFYRDGGYIEVEKEDKTTARYNNIFEYITAMKESGIIKEPYGTNTVAEDNYGYTPNLYHLPPSNLKRGSSTK
jgi:hypothetical protein